MLEGYSKNRKCFSSFFYVFIAFVHKRENVKSQRFSIDNECSETMRQWRQNNHVSNKARIWPQNCFSQLANKFIADIHFLRRHTHTHDNSVDNSGKIDEMRNEICLVGNYESVLRCVILSTYIYWGSNLHSVLCIVSFSHLIGMFVWVRINWTLDSRWSIVEKRVYWQLMAAVCVYVCLFHLENFVCKCTLESW